MSNESAVGYVQRKRNTIIVVVLPTTDTSLVRSRRILRDFLVPAIRGNESTSALAENSTMASLQSSYS